MKEYMKPEVEIVTLVAQEPITDIVDGSMGLEDSEF